MSDPIPAAEEAVLSDLAHKLVDQVALYGLAKEAASDLRVIEAIQRAKDARALLLQEISGKIWMRDLSGIDQAAKLGTAHKAFARLKDLPGKDNAVALDEVERGEAYLIDRFTRAVEDERLTAHTRNYLQTVVSRIEAEQARISELKAGFG